MEELFVGSAVSGSHTPRATPWVSNLLNDSFSENRSPNQPRLYRKEPPGEFPINFTPSARIGTNASFAVARSMVQPTIDAMLQAVPGIKDLASVKGEQISNVGSQDMSFDIMLKLANRINELAPTQDVDGFVITHGTDTMEETACFLNLVVKTDKPVVLVGSMRPSTAVSADGPLNLYNGVGVAVDPQARGRGVLPVMNDWIHGAHSLTKTNTTAVQTFMSRVRGVVGVAAYGKSDFYSTPPWKHTTNSEFS